MSYWFQCRIKRILSVASYRGDKIILTEVIESHHPDVLAFHADFRELINDRYSDEIEEYMEMPLEYVRL